MILSTFSVPRLKSISWPSIGLLMFLVVVLISGCSGSKRRLAAELKPISSPMNIERVWSVSVGKSTPLTFQPILNGDDIYTASVDGEIYRIDAMTGRVVWRVSIGTNIYSGVGTDGRVLVVANNKGRVFAYNAQSGAALWNTSVDTEVLTEPLVAGSTIVIRSINNRMVALDTATGKRRWVNQLSQSALNLRTSYSMLPINNEVLLTGVSGGRFGVFNLANGNVIWESLLAPPKGVSEIERLSDITSRPSLLANWMCTVSYQGKIGCGDIKVAAMLWTKDFSSYYGVSQLGQKVFAVNEKSHIVAFDSQKGDELWRNELLMWRDIGEPLATGKVVIAGDGQGYVHVFSQDNGSLLGRVRVDSSPVNAQPIAINGLMIFQSKAGTLAAYRIQ